jgi:biliverdin reductase
MEVHGDRAGLIFEGDQGTLITPEETIALPPVSRRGLFARDTQAVLDYLTTGTPLYVSPEASLAALRVADACRQAAESGQVIVLD